MASVQALRDHIDAVYDLTIGYGDLTPTLWKWAKGEVRIVHLHVQRFPIQEMPRNQEDTTQWLMHRFKEKDDRLEVFSRRGAF